MNSTRFVNALGTSWGDRCLTVSRGAAVTGACAAAFSSALTSIACAVMIASWAISGQGSGTIRLSLRQPLGLALAAFLALSAIGMIYSSGAWSDRWHDVWGWRKLAYGFLLLGFFAAGNWRRHFITAFLAVAIVGVVASFLAAAGLLPSRSGQIAGTIQGVVFQNHSVQGVVLSLAILCAAHLAKDAATRLRWVLGLAALAFAANIVYVLPGRSGYVALIIAAVTSAAMLFGWRRMHIWLSVFVVTGTIAFSTSPQLRARVMQAVNEVANADKSTELTSLGTRILFYRTTLELMEEKPILGYGSGSFGKEYREIVSRRYSDWRATPTTDPHNQYLFITMQLGVVGLIAFLAVIVAGFWTARASPYGWITGGALAIWCVTSLFSSHFRTFPEGHLIGLFLGAMLAAPIEHKTLAAR